MKVVIIGFGSIGQRWARILKSYENIQIYVLRRRRKNLVIAEDLQSSIVADPSSELNVKTIESLMDFPQNYFDVAIICTPINMHLKDWMLCFEAGIYKVLVEKPLFASLDSESLLIIEKIKQAIKEKKTDINVGFQSRYHPAIKEIMNSIADKTVGEIQYVRTHFGEFLPSMHPYEDYRATHMARAEEHGGPLACLSHDFDLIQYIFGDLEITSCNRAKFGFLSTSVSDSVNVTWRQKKKEEGISVAGDCLFDFITWPPERNIHLLGTLGTMKFNWITGILEIQSKKSGFTTKDFSYFNRNDLFKMEFEFFVRSNPSIENLENLLESSCQIAEYSERLR